jgi:hypothetical protein
MQKAAMVCPVEAFVFPEYLSGKGPEDEDQKKR